MIFLPIKPQYAFAIRDNEKLVEFRKRPFRNKDSKYCVVYVTSPHKKIIGYFSISRVNEGSPKEIWKKFNKVGGIKKTDYYEYFKGSVMAYAIEIEEFYPLKEPVDPFEKIEGFNIPQSFRYLSGKEINTLLPSFSAI
ncbi:MAG: hypothetical protein WCX95_03885 [Candidatus Gracilibacteria bacterium]